MLVSGDLGGYRRERICDPLMRYMTPGPRAVRARPRARSLADAPEASGAGREAPEPLSAHQRRSIRASNLVDRLLAAPLQGTRGAAVVMRLLRSDETGRTPEKAAPALAKVLAVLEREAGRGRS
jgi:hypothetical protein